MVTRDSLATVRVGDIVATHNCKTVVFAGPFTSVQSQGPSILSFFGISTECVTPRRAASLIGLAQSELKLAERDEALRKAYAELEMLRELVGEGHGGNGRNG